MPYGIITNALSILIGGIIGCALGGKLSSDLKSYINNLLGIAALTMGIVLILRVENLSVAILSLLLGGCIGYQLRIDKHIRGGANAVMVRLFGSKEAEEGQLSLISTALILFCCSGTGWYGALNEGMTGEGSILVTKAILDGITACVFAALLGKIVPCLALPQIAIHLLLFLVSGFIAPVITQSMVADFSAMGGIITLIAGLRLAGIKEDIPVLNLLPGLILSLLISAGWTAFVG